MNLGLKANPDITDEDIMNHVWNNFPKEYHVISDGLKNCLALSGDDT